MTKTRLAAVVLWVWAAWWAYFAFVQTPPLPIAAGVVGVLFALPLLAWKGRPWGGGIVVVEGLALLAWTASLANPPSTTLFLVLTLALPPLAAGLLMLADGWGKASAGAGRA